MNMDVKIYTTPTCGYCHQVKNFLSQSGVKFDEYDVSRDQAAAQEMIEVSGQMGVPVIVVDDEVIVGFDRPRLQALIASGGSGVKRVRFGIKIADAAKKASSSGIGPVSGVIVGEVSPGFLGEKAGLKEGDIITEISNHKISNVSDMEQVLTALQPGNIVTILFKRNREPRKSEVVA
jgi:glutaredoxin 3